GIGAASPVSAGEELTVEAISGDAQIRLDKSGQSGLTLTAYNTNETQIQYNSGAGSSGLRFTNGSSFDVIKFQGDGNIAINGASIVSMGSTVGDKLTYFSNTYGTGIEANTLTNWAATQFRWRVGG